MTGTSPMIPFNNGIEMPALGLGVYRSTPEETVGAVKAALAAGYRMIDTAAAYRNEAEVGQGLRESGIDRSDEFLQTKLWISDYGYAAALHGFDCSTRKLGFDTVDLYLLHQPAPEEFDRTIAAWRAAERLLTEGRTRAIGVCNFGPEHLERLMAEVEIGPAVNQVELHPFFTQKPLVEAHRKFGIVTQAWSPIGGVQRYWGDDKTPEDDPLTHPVIVGLARKYGKTPAQVMLRWHLDLGHSVVPKSAHKNRIVENFDIFEFRLSPEDIAAVDALDTGRRGGPDPEAISTRTYTAKIED